MTVQCACLRSNYLVLELIAERGRLLSRGLAKSTMAANFGGNPAPQSRPRLDLCVNELRLQLDAPIQSCDCEV